MTGDLVLACVSGDYQDNINRHARINTRCPSCRRQTIIIGAGRLLVCAFLGCHDPNAINEAADAAVEHKATRDRVRELERQQRAGSSHNWCWDTVSKVYRCSWCLVQGDAAHGPICPKAPSGGSINGPQ